MNSDVVAAATSASPLTPTHTYIGRAGFYRIPYTALPLRTEPRVARTANAERRLYRALPYLDAHAPRTKCTHLFINRDQST